MAHITLTLLSLAPLLYFVASNTAEAQQKATIHDEVAIPSAGQPRIDETDKRNWNKLSNMWGKKSDWNKLNNMWGKRGDWNQLSGAWGKRADWNKLNNMWGKRADWNKLNNMWGKRADWNKLNNMWGKRDSTDLELAQNRWNNLRGVWGKREDINLQDTDFLAQPDDDFLEMEFPDHM